MKHEICLFWCMTSSKESIIKIIKHASVDMIHIIMVFKAFWPKDRVTFVQRCLSIHYLSSTTSVA